MMSIPIENLTAFTFFSANLSKLLPHVPLADHPAYFEATGRYHRLAHDRRHDDTTLKQLPPMALQALRRAPGLVATYHIGAYKLLPLWLISQGIPLTLLVSADIAAKEYATYQATSMRFSAHGQPPLEILQAQDPLVIRKMVQSIGKGNWVLVFLDGNEGAGNKKSTAGRTDLVLDFLAHKLCVKTGVAELAYLMKCPIYPLALVFNDGHSPMPVGLPPMDMPVGLRQDVVRATMVKLYGWLADLVYQYPTQWEGWFYTHHDLLHDAAIDPQAFILQFLPFSVGHRYFVLQRETYLAYPASDQIFRKLCDFYACKIPRNN